MRQTVILGFFCFILLEGSTSAAMELNGFTIVEPLVPVTEILHGGPPRDGIPSLDEPKFIAASDNTFLQPNDRVLGVSLNGIQRAYPIGILNYHEIVNDVFDGEPVLISYCPLCGTGLAFNAMVDGQPLVFGVSGLLYNSDVLMYDRQTESLWSQIEQRAVNGPLKGQALALIPLEHTSWAAWEKRYPNTTVLSHQTGYLRNYARTPYTGYSSSERIYFSVSYSDKRYHPKEVVVGVVINGVAKAYPFVELSKVATPIHDVVEGVALTIHYDAEARSARITGEEGETIGSLTAYWFAWFTFHPQTDVFTDK
ncbi:MAG: hypothetical protein COA99_00550 [Moraxellaceae bacterium]|nr:MAG: hypothetical protein COA99_00550 [Moraxellaceae bacterium]